MKKILLFCISFMFATFFLIGCENKEINETPSSSQYEEQSSEAIKINKSFNIEESQVSEILSQEYTGSEIVVPIEVVLNNEILLAFNTKSPVEALNEMFSPLATPQATILALSCS